MPEGSNTQESLGGKIAETAAKLPEAAAKVIPQPKGPAERGLIGMLDAMGDGSTPAPRKSLEALAGAKLDTPPLPSVALDIPKSSIEKKADNILLPNSSEAKMPPDTPSLPTNNPEPNRTKQNFIVEMKGIGARFSINEYLESNQKSMQEGSTHVKKVYSTANVQDSLKEYRSNPSQETAQKLFDAIDSESGKRQVRWDEARKPCPHGIDPEECQECKKGATTPTSPPQS